MNRGDLVGLGTLVLVALGVVLFWPRRSAPTADTQAATSSAQPTTQASAVPPREQPRDEAPTPLAASAPSDSYTGSPGANGSTGTRGLDDYCVEISQKINKMVVADATVEQMLPQAGLTAQESAKVEEYLAKKRDLYKLMRRHACDANDLVSAKAATQADAAIAVPIQDAMQAYIRHIQADRYREAER